jgi:hypothetical protein
LKQIKKNSVRTETNRNSTCFGSFSVCFAKPINYFFGLFRFVSVFRIHIETTETSRSFRKKPKQKKKMVGKMLRLLSFFGPFFCEIKGPRVLALEKETKFRENHDTFRKGFCFCKRSKRYFRPKPTLYRFLIFLKIGFS